MLAVAVEGGSSSDLIVVDIEFTNILWTMSEDEMLVVDVVEEEVEDDAEPVPLLLLAVKSLVADELPAERTASSVLPSNHVQ